MLTTGDAIDDRATRLGTGVDNCIVKPLDVSGQQRILRCYSICAYMKWNIGNCRMGCMSHP
jgi:hypothetical protein